MPGLSIKNRITASFSQAAFGYDKSAVLQRRIGEQLMAELEAQQAFTNLDAQACWLDLGCGTGFFTEKLAQSCVAQGLALDIALGMLQYSAQRGRTRANVFLLNADAEILPLANQSIDLIFSNFALQWCLDLPAALAECWRVLKPGGWCGLTVPGEGSLKELQMSWSSLDSFEHVNRFYSSSALKRLLDQCLPETADICLSQGLYVDAYQDLKSLLKSLKEVGANTLTGTPSRGLMGRQQFERLQQNYEHYRQADGSLPLTYQVLTVLIKKNKF